MAKRIFVLAEYKLPVFESDTVGKRLREYLCFDSVDGEHYNLGVEISFPDEESVVYTALYAVGMKALWKSVKAFSATADEFHADFRFHAQTVDSALTLEIVCFPPCEDANHSKEWLEAVFGFLSRYYPAKQIALDYGWGAYRPDDLVDEMPTIKNDIYRFTKAYKGTDVIAITVFPPNRVFVWRPNH